MSNTTQNRFASVLDPTPGSALTTPVFAILPWGSGTQIQLKSNKAQSPVMMPNGASAGDQNTDYWVEGTFSGQLTRDTAIDNAFQSLLMAAYASNVLTPGSIEKAVCYEKTFYEGASTYYRQARGCQHSKLDIKFDASGIVDFSSDFVGQSDARSATIITGATYTAPGTLKKLYGTDVSVTIGGLTTTQLVKGSLSIDMDRKAQLVCNQTSAVGVGTSGMRTVSYSFSFYKRDFSFETGILANTPLAVALTMGGTNTGYRFDSAAVIFESPQDDDDDSGNLVTFSGTAAYDATAAADVKITKL